jgi:protein-S-isoprenylcysteine O-methyltransferase Ste14
MSASADHRPVSELFTDAINQFSELVRNEFALARAEIASKVSAAAVGIAMLGAAACLLVAAKVVLLVALAAWLSQLGLSDPLSYLVAGVVALLISAGLAYFGIRRLNPSNLTPHRTIEQVQRDVAAVRSTSEHEHPPPGTRFRTCAIQK